MFDTDHTQIVFLSFFSKIALKMLSRPQNIRVGRVDNLETFLPNMFTEETGFFYNRILS